MTLRPWTQPARDSANPLFVSLNVHMRPTFRKTQDEHHFLYFHK